MYQLYTQETYDQERFDNSRCARNLHNIQNYKMINLHSQATNIFILKIQRTEANRYDVEVVYIFHYLKKDGGNNVQILTA